MSFCNSTLKSELWRSRRSSRDIESACPIAQGAQFCHCDQERWSGEGPRGTPAALATAAASSSSLPSFGGRCSGLGGRSNCGSALAPRTPEPVYIAPEPYYPEPVCFGRALPVAARPSDKTAAAAEA